MTRNHSIVAAFFMLAAGACTQQAVEAVYKGENQYGKQNSFTHKTYNDPNPRFFSTNVDHNYQSAPANSSAPVATHTTTQVPMESVTVAPLTPITVNEAAPITKTAPVKTEKHSALEKKPAGNGPAHFVWPAEGKVVSSYGSKPGGKFNDGINIAAAEGEPIWAAADGKVVYAGNQLKGYGNMALVEHEGGMVSSYAHASSLLVKKGEQVKQGQVLGYVGRTGGVESAQLHFSLRQGKTPVNPTQYLAQDFASK